MTTATIDDIMTVAEAAEELGLGQHRVREFIREGRLTAVKRGPFYLVLTESLRQFQKLERPPGRPKTYDD